MKALVIYGSTTGNTKHAAEIIAEKLNAAISVIDRGAIDMFGGSKALTEGSFCGLILDEDNQSSMSDDRIEKWTGQLLDECA